MNIDSFKIYNDDALCILKNLPSNSIDSLVTDPPAGIGLINLEWDKDKGGKEEWIKWLSLIMTECHRVLKPGAHGFVWAIPRTSHWTATALEDSGFLVKDIVTHVFGSGFPKSQALDKMILRSKRLDMSNTYKVTGWIRKRKKELNLTNEKIDKYLGSKGCAAHFTASVDSDQAQIPVKEKWIKLKKLLGWAPYNIEKIVREYHQNFKNETLKSELLKESEKWKGWGTSLKPASEHWILIQKPLHKKTTIASNVLKFRTGALNIDASRVKSDDSSDLVPRSKVGNSSYSPYFGSHTKQKNKVSNYTPHELGRHPSNFVVTQSKEEEIRFERDQEKNSGCPLKLLDSQFKDSSRYFKQFSPSKKIDPFFYSPKPNRFEKEEFNTHPTVKPLKLMNYLIQMITPLGGTVLDPFMGSGTTGVAAVSSGFKFIGLEKEQSYFEISKKRLENIVLKNNKNKTPQFFKKISR